jgi:glucose/arabinose dehydrogenase
MKQLLLLLIVFSLFACSDNNNVSAQNTGIETRIVADGLGIPWEMALGPDGWIWFSERNGKFKRVNPETGEVVMIKDIGGVFQLGESGLLGFDFHPDFPETPYIYMVYTYGTVMDMEEKLVRFTYEDVALTNETTLLDGIDAAQIHDGSRIVVHPEEMVIYMTTGDASEQHIAQDLSSLNGKTLRINLDGSVPGDNPYGDYVWSHGHRNAQGLVFANGYMYQSEHGPDTDDEINIVRKGRNYGWPNVKGFCNEDWEMQFCEDSNVVEPLIAWTPTIATCGIDYYGHDAIAGWKNSILLATLKGSTLYQLKLSGDGSEIVEENKYLAHQFGRLRDVMVHPDGRVFISTSNYAGGNEIVEIKAKETGVGESKDKGRLRISPNPSNGNINIEYPAAASCRLMIVNSLGEIIEKTDSRNTAPGVMKYSNLPAGAYRAVLLGRNINCSESFIIVN